MAFDGAAIKALLDGAVSNGAVHGIAAVVVDRNGQLFHHAAGEAREHTLFRNASMTKAVATTAALQLVEQGRLGLEATVESILPEFGQLQVLEGFDGDKPRLRPPASQATVRQLMTHSAGLGYFFLSEKLLRYHELTGEPNPLSGLKRSSRCRSSTTRALRGNTASTPTGSASRSRSCRGKASAATCGSTSGDRWE
jgi:CubicO group peptidase (beta-lactamase class C family)